MVKILQLLICLLGAAYAGADTGALNDEQLPWVEHNNMKSSQQIDEPNEFGNILLKLNKIHTTPSDDNELKNEIERRLTEELEGLMKKLEQLRKRLAESPNDRELKNETERVKEEYHRKVQHYNRLRLPRSKRILEGDMTPENMPWDRADGGKVSVTFRHRGKEIPVSDEEAETVRVFLDDHASEWLRGNQSSTEGMLNQIVFVGSVTVRKENGYSRTYVIVHGEGLRWNDCYLPSRAFSDNSYTKIERRYIKNVSKLPIDPEARKWLECTRCK